MVEWSIAAFRACDSVAAVVLAVPPGMVGEVPSRLPGIAQALPGGASTMVVAGGATRAQSVANALEAVETELVAIHDAARPLITPELVEAIVATLEAAPEAAGAIPAAPVTDTIKRAALRPRSIEPVSIEQKMGLAIESTLDRSRLWAAQTPQVFRAEALRAALAVDAEARDAATDEAMLIEAVGGTVLIHPSSPENLKVTTPLDLRLAELLLAQRTSP
jgi:2-C-methyl-D-erythritol 4-phosphate cytidylyltransferase